MQRKYALVHEWFTPEATGGSELVVREILRHFDADVYALIDFESQHPDSYLFQRQIGTTFLQHFPKARYGVQKYLPLLPLAIEQLDLRDYDVILSSSHAVAKSVLAAPHQIHICYCHTPMRYAWDLTFDYLKGKWKGGILGWLVRYLLHRLRVWDAVSANRVDYFIANSQHTARRIWRCYRRQAEVIHPPVRVERFPMVTAKEDFYLTVSRLVSYKKVSVIVNAFNRMGKPLVVIGTGSDLPRIRALAGDNVQVLGKQPDSVVQEYMGKAKAFVYAACEDFGMALVEAQACGTPVIAYGAGGALETVRDVRKDATSGTGLFFDQQSEEAIIEAVEAFEWYKSRLSPEMARSQAERFTPTIFQEKYVAFVKRCLKESAASTSLGTSASTSLSTSASTSSAQDLPSSR